MRPKVKVKQTETHTEMTFWVKRDLKASYSKYAKEHGYSVSGRLRMFMEKDMAKKIKIEDE